jgi:hypothetical protein
VPSAERPALNRYRGLSSQAKDANKMIPATMIWIDWGMIHRLELLSEIRLVIPQVEKY